MFIGEGIEGFYLLRGIPHAEAKYIPPQEFPDNAREGILACLDCVNSTFSNSPEIIREWNNWAHLYCPATDNAHDYVQQLRQNGVGYHIPLKALLLDSAQILHFPAWREKPMQAFPVDNTNMFEWPEVLSAAMHSVRTSMNLHPPVSRLHVPRDEQLVMELNTFMTNVGPVYYDTVLRGNLTTIPQLKQIIDRKVGYSGEISSKSGTLKITIITFVTQMYVFFICRKQIRVSNTP